MRSFMTGILIGLILNLNLACFAKAGGVNGDGLATCTHIASLPLNPLDEQAVPEVVCLDDHFQMLRSVWSTLFGIDGPNQIDGYVLTSTSEPIDGGTSTIRTADNRIVTLKARLAVRADFPRAFGDGLISAEQLGMLLNTFAHAGTLLGELQVGISTVAVQIEYYRLVGQNITILKITSKLSPELAEALVPFPFPELDARAGRVRS